MPDPDLIYKHYRIRDKTIIVAFCYFDHSTGLNGVNLDKLKNINRLRDRGHCEVLVAGDFNMIRGS